MNITLGSTSTHKLAAVESACKTLGLEAMVSGVKTLSGQNEQPVGFEETYNGALTRATSAQAQRLYTIAIGIESGIFRFGATPKTLDIAVIVVITPGGRQIVTTSEGIQFPENCVKIADERGFEITTVGSIISEKFGGDPSDPHSILTDGKVTRKATLVGALVTAFKQL